MNILIIPDDGGRVRRFRVPVVSLWAVCAGATVLAALVLCSIGVYWNSHIVHKKFSSSQRENEILHGDLARFESNLATLESRLDNAAEMENQARLLAGLDPLHEATQAAAVGGPSLDVYTEGLDPDLAVRLSEIDDRLRVMSEEMDDQEKSYQTVITTLQDRAEELERIPTITPLKGDFYLSSGYGRRIDPFTGRPSMHEGHDYVAPKGTPFYASAKGTVKNAGRNGDFGLSVKVIHGNGIVTIYGHADKIFVKVGEQVERGQILGVVGESGRTTGPHLHYEVQVDGRTVNPGRFILEKDRVVD